jgi:hypothetical protein
MRTTVFLIAVMLIAGSAATSHAVTRYQFIPGSNGNMGDLWTFYCPAGGTVDVTVDTITGNNNLDPALQVLSGDGTSLAFADDTFICSVAPSCGFSCPRVLALACGAGTTHSIKVIGSSVTSCVAGGYYSLTVVVRDAAAVALDPAKTKLGGGPKRKVPAWLDTDKTRASGPVLDDEALF